MAGDPVGWGHDTLPPRSEDHELFAELSELIARVDGIPDAVLEAARAAGLATGDDLDPSPQLQDR